MCNLYANTTTQEAMRHLFDVLPERDRLGNAEPLTGIYPKYDAPIVRLSVDGEREMVMTSWGFRRTNKSKKTGAVIAPGAVNNARDDKISTSFFWRFSFAERRCLVPASSYSEWPLGGNPQVFHWFSLTGDEPRPPFAFAGLWQTSKYETKDGPEACETHTIVTTSPNDLVATVHPTRMPVILDPADYETWLNRSTDDALALLRPYPADQMRISHKGEALRRKPTLQSFATGPNQTLSALC